MVVYTCGSGIENGGVQCCHNGIAADSAAPVIELCVLIREPQAYKLDCFTAHGNVHGHEYTLYSRLH